MKSIWKVITVLLIVLVLAISESSACFKPSEKVNNVIFSDVKANTSDASCLIKAHKPFYYTKYILPSKETVALYGKDLYISYIAEIHEKYYPNVDPYIVMAVMEMESRYEPDVVSSAGAVGLMQVLPKYHEKRIRKYGLTDLMDPYSNIIAGMDLLNDLYANSGNWRKALLGYNNSKKYVNFVLSKSDKLREGGYFG